MPEKLMIDVPQDGYTLREGEHVLRAKVSAGASRQRLDQIDAPLEADVQLFLSPSEYQYWRAFYRRRITFGALPFLMGIVIDSGEVEDCEVKLIPGTYATNIRGDAHVVQFQIEVKRPLVSEDDDEAVLAAFGTYGGLGGNVFDLLEMMVNSDLPDAVP